jgi:homopolymeric O-antigen transport system permease protein
MTGLLRQRFEYLHRIWELRYFWFSLVRNDLNTRYRGSFLGIGWSLLKPLSMTVIYCIVFAKVFHVEIAEYAPYLLIGMTTWQFICESILQGSYSFTLGSAYIRQQRVPLAIFPLRSVLGTGFHALVALAVALAVTLFFRSSLNLVGLLCLIPAMVLLLILGWCLAILSGVLYTHFPDTRHLFEVGLQMLFYVTPILYRPSDLAGRGRIVLFFDLNPLTSIMALTRSPVLEGTPPSLFNFQIALVFIGICAALAILVLRKLERTLVFWV